MLLNSCICDRPGPFDQFFDAIATTRGALGMPVHLRNSATWRLGDSACAVYTMRSSPTVQLRIPAAARCASSIVQQRAPTRPCGWLFRSAPFDRPGTRMPWLRSRWRTLARRWGRLLNPNVLCWGSPLCNRDHGHQSVTLSHLRFGFSCFASACGVESAEDFGHTHGAEVGAAWTSVLLRARRVETSFSAAISAYGIAHSA